MLSLSKSEFRIIGFLVRNFFRKLTIRNIALELKISAAGAHAVFKKLEKNSIVKGEKLGTGIFYSINFENKVATHLAAASLLDYFNIKKIETKELEKESDGVIFDGKNAVVITGNEEKIRNILFQISKEIQVVCREKEQFVESLRNKELLEILQKGNVLFGEEAVIESIRKVMR